ncbi:MAG: hypothetical protein CL816_05350 [Coxiellaceae bacterium]|nr:hypothetical protein [Coxiellaceae bacterium]|tara:strand:+ start:8825 stop:9511 length:687 start_codon:yes stop_codon:yes gene_type:complete
MLSTCNFDHNLISDKLYEFLNNGPYFKEDDGVRLESVRWVDNLSDTAMKLTKSQMQRLSSAGSLTHYFQTSETLSINFKLLALNNVQQPRMITGDDTWSDCEGDWSQRIVSWFHADQTWVYAESWIPPSLALQYQEQVSDRLPLGKWLFNGQAIELSPFKFVTLVPSDPIMQRVSFPMTVNNSSLWIARCRQYKIAEHPPLIVIEVFFQPCLDHFALISEEATQQENV